MNTAYGPVFNNRKSFDMIPWDKMMCCPKCQNRYSLEHVPINIRCSHTLCRPCLQEGAKCPFDQSELGLPVDEAAVNFTFLRMMGIFVGRQSKKVADIKNVDRLDGLLARMGRHFEMTSAEFGGSVISSRMSNSTQRKILILMRGSVMTGEGRFHCLKNVRSIANRILTEVLQPFLSITSTTMIWDALRNRNCQFLGPDLYQARPVSETQVSSDRSAQRRAGRTPRDIRTRHRSRTQDGSPRDHAEDDGALPDRLEDRDQPPLPNPLQRPDVRPRPRENKSPVLRLKPEFEEFDDFRREHDISLVRTLMHEGVFVDKVVLSKLIYGTWRKRPYMQSILDRITNRKASERKFDFPASLLAQKIREGPRPLRSSQRMAKIVAHLEKLEEINYTEEPEWKSC
ncbi:hypothetical protein L596_022897 [Steinernema carpocapsae]|uniref:RING-type domain-containing protein n=1 Tax=Steinernema carpocapsae TaxID=34508 RepID=A0A4U5MBW9_STECR|nr:hypothetical protein L596_022897 [Steinernema carpocapsae]